MNGENKYGGEMDIQAIQPKAWFWYINQVLYEPKELPLFDIMRTTPPQ